MSVAVRMALLALLIGGVIGFGVFLGQGSTPADAPQVAAGTRAWRSSTECATCHRAVWDEWNGSHHQIAYLNPEVRKLSDDFRNKECQACHLPRPVSVTGYGKRTLHRRTRPDEGVGCLTCHLGADGRILGRETVPDAPCRPRASAELISVDFCASCHNQHKTTDQWQATRFAREGVDCNGCHMQDVTRTTSRAGPRSGRSHGFAGSHDVDVLRSALEFDARADAGQLVVKIANVGAGHNFPTEERSRAADVMVQFTRPDQEPTWQRAFRFRLPYRSEPLPDTTLPAAQTREVEVAIPADATAAVARLWYRLTPFVGDGDPLSALLFEQRIELDNGHGVPGRVVTPGPQAGSSFTPGATEAMKIRSTAPPMAQAPQPSRAPPPLPPLVLEPRLASFRTRASAGPPAPSEQRRAELADLLATAFAPGRASPRIANLSKRSLLADDDAAWALESGLDHTDATVRSHAAFELGELGRTASVLPLLLRLKNEEDPHVRVWVAGALAQLGNHAGLPALVELMDRGDTANQAGLRAVEICRTAGRDPGEAPTYPQLQAILRELHDAWRETGGPATEIDDLTTARIAAHLAHLEQFQLREVDEARFVLSRMGAQALPLLIQAAGAREPYLRTHTLEILRDLGHAARPAAPAVLPLLADDLTRVDAIRVLGRIGAETAVPHLVARLDDPDVAVQSAAAEALGWIGDDAATAPLRELFAREDQPLDTRVMAAFSLALLAPDGPARAWLEQLRDSGGYHRPTIDELLVRIDGAR